MTITILCPTCRATQPEMGKEIVHQEIWRQGQYCEFLEIERVVVLIPPPRCKTCQGKGVTEIVIPAQ